MLKAAFILYFCSDPKEMRKTLLFCLIYCLAAFSSNAQDVILLNNGASLECKVLSANDYEVKYEVTKKSGKKKTRYMEKEMVFSVMKEDGTEQIFYKRNPDRGNFLEVDQMRKFIYGAQDAQKHYKARLPFILGLGVSTLGGVVTGSFLLVALVPFGGTLIAAIPPVHPHSRYARDKNLIDDPSYVLGYERTARNKKIMNALLGSVIGTTIGFGINQAAGL